MTFDPDDPRLTAFALGELDDDDDRDAVAALLARSPEASRYVDELRETAALLAETLRDEPSPGLSIVQRIDLDARLGGGPRRRGVRRGLVALAAGVALALGGYGVGLMTAPGAGAARRGSVAEVALLAPEADVAEEAEAVASAEPADPDSDKPEGRGAVGLPTMALAAEPQERAEALVADEAMAGPTAPPEADTRSFSRESFALDMGEILDAEQAPGSGLQAGQVSAEDASFVQRSRAARLAELRQRAMRENEAAGYAPSPGEPAAEPPAAPMSAATIALESATTDAQAEGSTTTNMLRGAGGANSLAMVPGQGGAPAPPAASEPAGRDTAAALQDQMGISGYGVAGAEPMQQVGGAPREGFVTAAGAVAAGGARAAKVEAGNVVEVIDLPEGEVARRIIFEAPVQDVAFDPSGTRLLATSADRSMTLFDVESGRLLNKLQVVEGRLPEAQFGRPGEVILRNFGSDAGRDGDGPGMSWFRAESAPVVAIPVGPGVVSLGELAGWLSPDRQPGAFDDPVLRLVNTPPYPYERPVGGEAVAVDARVVQAPWDERNRLVRIALVARSADGDGPPPVVAERVEAEVEFNPGRVLAYRPIGFEPQSESGIAPEAEGKPLTAGAATTVLFEIEPAGDGRGMARGVRPYRYQDAMPTAGPAAGRELLTVTLSYREPGGEDRRTVDRHVTDADVPVAEAPDDVRLASALGWLGMALRVPAEGRGGALDGVSALIRSCEDDFLPEFRRELLGLIDRARGEEDRGGPD